MFFRHHTDKLVIPIILGAAVFATSYRSKYHLRAEMPTAFAEENQNAAKSSPEQKIAAAYWQAALTNVQFKYPYSYPLPVNPPPEFVVDPKAFGGAASDSAARLHYWHQLQKIWYTPETWNKEYGWDFTWLGSPLESGGSWLRSTADRLFSVR